MNNNSKNDSVMTVVMAGMGRRGTPCHEWKDEIKDWCQTDICSLVLISPLIQKKKMTYGFQIC